MTYKRKLPQYNIMMAKYVNMAVQCQVSQVGEQRCDTKSTFNITYFVTIQAKRNFENCPIFSQKEKIEVLHKEDIINIIKS